MNPDREIIEAAANVIHGYCQSRQRLSGRYDVKDAPNEVRLARFSDAEGAILKYIEMMRARGFAMVPREPTVEMFRAGIEERQNPKGGSGLKGDWRAMFDAHQSGENQR